jgi:hypothetical protein
MFTTTRGAIEAHPTIAPAAPAISKTIQQPTAIPVWGGPETLSALT